MCFFVVNFIIKLFCFCFDSYGAGGQATEIAAESNDRNKNNDKDTEETIFPVWVFIVVMFGHHVIVTSALFAKYPVWGTIAGGSELFTYVFLGGAGVRYKSFIVIYYL